MLEFNDVQLAHTLAATRAAVGCSSELRWPWLVCLPGGYARTLNTRLQSQTVLPSHAFDAFSISVLVNTWMSEDPSMRVPGNSVPGAPGVGHLGVNGGGARNKFGIVRFTRSFCFVTLRNTKSCASGTNRCAADSGLDFAANQYTWNSKLCKSDSDGDGLTNGEELGDPCCVWRPGAIPARTTLISHPGQASSSTPQASVGCDETAQPNAISSGPVPDTSRACAGARNIIVLSAPSMTSKTQGAARTHACLHAQLVFPLN
jgi:hypothetical protein